MEEVEEERWGFPNENDTCRIQKLYYDVNINTIFNRTKLRNLKHKFVKYVKFITKFKQNIVDPAIHTYQKIQDDAYQTINECRVDDALQTSFTNEDVEKGQALFEIFNDAKDDCDKVKYYSLYWADSIEHIYNKINEINKQSRNIYKNYKKCSHCENMNIVTNCGCKSKHKLCSVCSDDITECPVCNDDLGLQHCDICMVYKKELVDTGCKNKHPICKECLEQIQKKKQRKQRVLDMNIRNGYHRDSDPYYFEYKCPFCRDSIDTQCDEEEYYDWPGYDDDVVYINDPHDIELIDDLNRAAWIEREREEEEYDRRDHMEDRREAMRERANDRR